MRRAWLRGLRGRITVALVAVSVLTLAVEAVTLLLPLDRHLRADAVRSLRQTAATARPDLADLPRRAIRAGSPELRAAAVGLRRRADAEVIVIDRGGRPLVSTDPAALHTRLPAVARALERRSHAEGRSGPDVIEAAVRVDAGGRPFGLVLLKSLQEVSAAEGVVRRALVVSGALGLVAAMLAGTLLAGRLVRRLHALRNRMADVGGLDRADQADAATDHARDEIGDLDRSFAAMRRRLADQERSRRSFVATASHELRTPLASLQLILDSVDAELDADQPQLDDAREQVARGRAQSERLVQLAADLLDLSRLDAAQPLRCEPVDLGDLTQAVATEFPAAVLHVSDAGAGWALADPGGTARIVRILIDNALRHGGAAGPVDVAVEGARIEVVDTGPGIPPDERESVFERFRRGSSSATGTGFGLGLAIARELARGMGGDVRIAGGPPGARFVVELPPLPAHELAEAG
jgi:signal transduction histidine kinase